MKATTVAKLVVEEIICRYGTPKVIISDRGGQFTGKVMTQVNEFLGIKGKPTTAYHPQTDGLVERLNDTLIQMVKNYVNDKQDDWDEYIPYMLAAYRGCKHSTTGEAPYSLLFGRDYTTPIDIAPRIDHGDDNSKNEYVNRLKDMHEKVRGHVEKAQKQQKKQYNKRRKKFTFETDEEVMLYTPSPLPKGQKKKFQKQWRGPFIIIEKEGDLNYIVAPKDNLRAIQKVHIDRLKKYFPPENQGENDEEEYEIEDILDVRGEDSDKEYLVKWKGFTKRYNSWVKKTNVNAPNLLKKFKNQLRRNTNRSQLEDKEKEN